MQTPLLGAANLKPLVPKSDSPLMQKAKELEASFLSEMLGHAGLGAGEGGLGGGIGEEQFASFLRDAQAKQMVAHGGIGLAEQLFHAMSKGQNNAD
jgi:peptidoglycan hydrolase FlgJ